MDSERLIEFVRNYPELYDVSHKKYTDNNRKEMIWTKIGEKLGQTGQSCKKSWINLRDSYRRSIRKRKDYKCGQAAHKIRKWRYEEQMLFLIPYFQERESINNFPQTSIENENQDEFMEINLPALEFADSEQKESLMEGLLETTDEGLEALDQAQYNMSDKSKHSQPPVSSELKERQHFVAKQNSEIPNASAVLIDYILKNIERDDKVHPIDKFFSTMADTVKSFSKINQHKAKANVFQLISTIEMEEIMSKSAFTEINGTKSEKIYTENTNSQEDVFRYNDLHVQVAKSTNFSMQVSRPEQFEPKIVSDVQYSTPPHSNSPVDSSVSCASYNEHGSYNIEIKEEGSSN